MYYTYVLRSLQNGVLYKGQTDDLKSRLLIHNSGLVSYSKRYLPWELVYFEEFETRAEAMAREKFFKTGAGRDWLKRKLNETTPEAP
jgi:putative endonuclease